MRQRILSLMLVTAAAGAAGAQGTGAAPRPAGATLRGVVRDSLAYGPLAGAWVQLVEANVRATTARTVLSDSLGRFAFANVADGRYVVGFFHPMLDSLGLEAPVRQVAVRRRRAALVELATPSAACIRTAVCSQVRGAVTGGAVLGVVRDARTRGTVAGATVTGEWLEISLVRGGRIEPRRRRISVTTAENGWFALCNVPARGMMYLHAHRDADSTDLIDVQVQASGFARQELFVGPSRVVVMGDAAASDSLLPARTVRVGDGELHGAIVTAGDGRRVAEALVRLGDNLPVRTDDRGAFTIAGAPFGTRMLEVRAVGFTQARTAVHVVRGAAPITVPLVSSQAVLDTVRVVVARAADWRASGFEDRRRSGAGTYLDARHIARRGAFVTSDLFRHLRSVKIGFDYDTLETDANPNALSDVNQMSDRRVLMRGISGNWCEPALWFDGNLIPELSVYALDGWVTPERLAAIEIYSEATVPPQFQRSRSGCGAILFWTK